MNVVTRRDVGPWSNRINDGSRDQLGETAATTPITRTDRRVRLAEVSHTNFDLNRSFAKRAVVGALTEQLGAGLVAHSGVSIRRSGV